MAIAVLDTRWPHGHTEAIVLEVRMRVDFGAVEALVLSHGHWDHGGGVLEAVRRAVVLRLMRAASGRDCWIIEFCV